MSVSVYAGEKEILNVSNANAKALFALTAYEGLDDYCGGKLEPSQLPDLRVRLEELLSHPDERQAAQRPARDDGGPGTGQCRIIDAGTNDVYVVDRLGALLDAVRICLEENVSLHWG